MKRPFFTIGLSMLCTMFLLFAVGTLYTLVFVAVLLVIAAAVALAKRRKASVLLLVGIAALLSVLCFSYTFNSKFTPAITYCGENISIRGTLAEYPRSEDAHSHVYKLKDCEIAGKQTDITVELYNKYLYNCRPGDTLQFTASQLKATERNPTLKTFFLLADGIWLYAYTDSVFIEPYSGSRLRYAAQDLQHTVLQIIADRMQAPEASVLSALMLGRHDTMTLQTAMSFRLCGLAHLFAVSGLHLTFWVSFLLRFFGKHRRHKIPTLAAIGFILFFMALTGFSVSVCRAGFMMIVLLIGNLFRYEPDALNSLGLAVAVLLILNPFSAASASLLLSASATAAIVLTATPVERYITLPLLKPVSNVFLKNNFSSMLGILFTSATTLTALLPLNAYFFGNFSLLAPVSNLLCIPAAEFGMIFGTAAVLCSPIPYFSDCLFSVTEQLLHYVIFISQKIAELPFAIYYTHLKFVFAWAAICAVVLFTFWLCNKRNRKRIFIAAMSCFCALYIGLHISSFADKDHLTLTVYNADNDICITLHDMHGNAAVIGCGNDDYTIEKVYSDLHYAGVLQPRLLLIPRIKAEMNADIQKCIDLWQPQKVLSAVHFKSTDNDILTASESTVTLWDKVNLHYRSDETFSAITISTAETRVLICCAPYSDFTACDENFTSADILICRQSVPTTLCTDSFQQIVLSSDKKEELYRFTDPLFAEKTVCTADEGNITLTIG